MLPLMKLYFWLIVLLRTEFLIKILTGAHTRIKILNSCQKIDDLSKYIRFDPSIFVVKIFFDKKSPAHSQISRQNFDVNNYSLLQNIDIF